MIMLDFTENAASKSNTTNGTIPERADDSRTNWNKDLSLHFDPCDRFPRWDLAQVIRPNAKKPEYENMYAGLPYLDGSYSGAI